MTLNSAVLDVPTSENTGHHAVSTAAVPLSFEDVGQSFPVPGGTHEVLRGVSFTAAPARLSPSSAPPDAANPPSCVQQQV